MALGEALVKLVNWYMFLQNSRDKTRGFTIIELLVIVSIIGFLISIVFVSVGGTRAKSKVASGFRFSQTVNHALGVDAVGIWDFDEGEDATANDRSGYGNNGTVNGAVYSDDTPHAVIGSGQGKYALSFDGMDDYVDCGKNPSLSISSNVTLELWIKISSSITDMGLRNLIGQPDPYRNYNFYVGGNGTGGWQLYLSHEWEGAGFKDSETDYILSRDLWYHIVGIISIADGGLHQYYVNGKLVTESKNLGFSTIKTNTANKWIGRADNYFDGLIDEVRIYAQALTPSEIQKHYADGAARHGLVLQLNN